ncbi:hypothetical protein F4819DRAFT_464310, partial [Hypoxylon fuscum]
MCFTEHIGYTCGHSSVPVKRACPLTTEFHGNQCCSNSATRPILALTFCPPCARIVHGRWVNIIQFEHRFMHERGACGCEVVFPNLQHPRVVSHEASAGDAAPDAGTPGEARSSVVASQRGDQEMAHRYMGFTGQPQANVTNVDESGRFPVADHVSAAAASTLGFELTTRQTGNSQMQTLRPSAAPFTPATPARDHHPHLDSGYRHIHPITPWDSNAVPYGPNMPPYLSHQGGGIPYGGGNVDPSAVGETSTPGPSSSAKGKGKQKASKKSRRGGGANQGQSSQQHDRGNNQSHRRVSPAAA